MNYDYSQTEAYAKAKGLVIEQDILADFDNQAAFHGFTQSQVDMALHHHINHVARIFDPSKYSLKQRLALASWFLFGRKKNA